MKELLLLSPEIVLLLTVVGIVISEIAYFKEKFRFTTMIALLGLSIAILNVFLTYQESATVLFSGLLSVDGLSLFFKLFSIFLAIVSVCLTVFTREIPEEKRPEYYSLFIAAALMMCFVASASHLIMIFISFVALNFVGIFLVGFRQQSVESTQSATKYFFASSVSSALFLFGSVILYSHVGTLDLYEIHKFLQENPMQPKVHGLVFFLMFFSFATNAGLFPMSLWFGDTLHGAPNPSSLVFSLGVPAAVLSSAIRTFGVLFSQKAFGFEDWSVWPSLDWTAIVSLSAAITFLMSAIVSFKQVSVKKIIASLVMMEIGFLTLGLNVLDQVGLGALLYSIIVDLFSLAGVFCAFSFLKELVGTDSLEDIGRSRQGAGVEAFFLLVFLSSFLGMPPFPGVLSKFALIGSVMRSGSYALVIVSLFAMIVCVKTFVQLAFALFGKMTADREKNDQIALFSVNRKSRLFLFGLTLPLFFLTAFANLVFHWTERTVRIILW